VYFWDRVAWKQLETQLDTYHNFASAPTQGPGLYALMSSIEIPLYGPGWNLFSYPVPMTRTVPNALLSISGYYTTVYGYEATDATDPWKVYDVTVPEWVNDLHMLEFGRGYWINVSEAITLFLKGPSDHGLQRTSDATLTTTGSLQSPPATYYGAVLAGSDFTATAGMPVTAWVGGHRCGRSQTLEAEGQVAYSVNVFANGPGDSAGCGASGQTVTFRVGSRVMAPTAVWDNSRLWEVPLRIALQMYLPLIVKEY
jgi:hypothetical protein